MNVKRWDVDGHEVKLEWTYWGGARVVTVDGASVASSRVPMRWKSEQRFEVDGKQAVVRTKPSNPVSAFFIVELEVDGREVQPVEGRSGWESVKSA